MKHGPRPTGPPVRLRGRAKRGTRLIDTTPHGHWKTSTFIAALSEDGLIAPGVFDGPINGELFLAYVEQIVFRRGKLTP